MKNILVTIDFADKVEFLIDQACELAESLDSKIWLLHVASEDANLVGFGIGSPTINDSRAEVFKEQYKLLQKYVIELKEKGVDAEGLIIQGSTIESVISESKKLNIDIIVAGYHEHGFLYKAFIGSVSAEILKIK